MPCSVQLSGQAPDDHRRGGCYRRPVTNDAPLVAAAHPVVVTGAGGPAGVAVVRTLVDRGEQVVAVDADPEGVGLALAPLARVVPRAGDGALIDALCALSTEVGGATALVPTVAEELAELHGGRERLAAAGVQLWLPDPEAVATCLDKARFAAAMAAAGVPVPPTAPAERGGPAPTLPGPWVVKPRFGRGSRHVLFAESEAELAAALLLVPDPIVQQRAPGTEFTADALVDRNHELVGLVCRWRLETRGGISTRGTTFVDPAVTEAVAGALAAADLEGPANVQGFAEGSSVWITEINPRFSGGLPLSLAAGADLVGEYLRAVRGGAPRPERLRAATGVSMRRYFVEVFSSGTDPASPTTSHTGRPDGAGTALPIGPLAPNPARTLGAVLFDLDDTLAPQATWLDGAFAAVARRAADLDPAIDARSLHEALLAEAAAGSARGGIIDRALASLGLAIDVGLLVEAFRSYRPARFDPYPGALELLERLRTAGMGLAVVSDGDPDIQRAKLGLTGVAELVDAVVLSDELGRRHRKPAPLPFRTALAALEVTPAEAAFVGDRPETDLLGAARVGMATVRVRTGEYAAAPSPVSPTADCADLTAVAAWLGDRTGGRIATTRQR